MITKQKILLIIGTFLIVLGISLSIHSVSNTVVRPIDVSSWIIVIGILMTISYNFVIIGVGAWCTSPKNQNQMLVSEIDSAIQISESFGTRSKI